MQHKQKDKPKFEKKKVVVDLDVTTVAKWDKGKNGDAARKLVTRIEKEEFEMFTPYIILDLLSEWKHASLVKAIKEFYEFYSSKIISVINLEDRITDLNFDRKALTAELKSFGIKDEDIILVIVCSIFNADYLITFNRKHLKNNEVKINDLLRKYSLKPIKIVLPDEL